MNRLLASACLLPLLASPTLAQSVTVAVAADVRSINPGVNRDDNTDDFALQMVEGLVGYDEGGIVQPLLAEKVETSADGKTYTFTFRRPESVLRGGRHRRALRSGAQHGP